jgi:hypothetical protein
LSFANIDLFRDLSEDTTDDVVCSQIETVETVVGRWTEVDDKVEEV